MSTESLLEVARAADPSATDESLIVAIARKLVDVLDLEPPVDPGMVASYQGIRRIEEALIPWAGCLIPGADEVVIRVRSTDTPGRRRFTVLHEVVHTFFPGYRHATQYRCTPKPLRTSGVDDIEVLCDIGASELLLPRRHCADLVAEASFDLDSVEDLAKACGASLEAAARRFVSLWPEPCLLVRMERMTKPREPDGVPKLRVSSALASGAWPFMPRYKSVPDDHVVGTCLDVGEVRCVTDLDAVARTGPLDVHARFYPFNDSEGAYRERVLVLARRV